MVNARWSFSPCALNTFGALGVDAVALLQRISVIRVPQPDAPGPSTSSMKDISTDLPDLCKRHTVMMDEVAVNNVVGSHRILGAFLMNVKNEAAKAPWFQGRSVLGL